ncbi:MAG TPA: hypothetical protein PKK82_05035, partial [Anaerolineaceae bacterium]|nr:hypothetical protein [Anaerolineaceae bacterium]
EMKKKLIVVLFVVILVISLPRSEVQAAEEIIWEKTGPGIEGTGIIALAIDPQTPSTLYAVTPRKVYKGVNGGESWSPSSNGLTADSLSSLVIDPQTP